MQFTRFGGAGLTVPRLGLGTMTFGLQTDEATSAAILHRSAEAGVTFIDTADVYPLGGDSGSIGRTEEIGGRWMTRFTPSSVMQLSRRRLIPRRSPDAKSLGGNQLRSDGPTTLI
jgi:aryl-alcohol dehydrogenase-like predicted oxidoreductase